jgi:phage tail-like protein
VTLEAFPACRFYVEIGGIAVAVFTEVGGLEMETEVFDYEEGGNNGFIHRLPGRSKCGNLTLKRGMTRTNELLKWYVKVVQGQIDRRNLTVVLYDVKGEVLARWTFANAYPVKWAGPQLQAEGNAVAIETLEIAHDGLGVES